MVFAKSRDAASFLCEAWRAQSVEKVYVAVVRKWPPFQERGEKSGIIDLPLEPSEIEPLKWQVADNSNPDKKPSQTKWKVLKQNYCLPDWCKAIYGNEGDAMFSGIVLELRPITGRTHQLRVHCAEVGSGILGDSLYGEDRIWDTSRYNPNDAARYDANGPRLMLHASELTFPRPPGPSEGKASPEESTTCTVSSWPEWFKLWLQYKGAL